MIDKHDISSSVLKTSVFVTFFLYYIGSGGVEWVCGGEMGSLLIFELQKKVNNFF